MLTYVRGDGPTIADLKKQITALEGKQRDKTQDALLSMLKTCLRLREAQSKQ